VRCACCGTYDSLASENFNSDEPSATDDDDGEEDGSNPKAAAQPKKRARSTKPVSAGNASRKASRSEKGNFVRLNLGKGKRFAGAGGRKFVNGCVFHEMFVLIGLEASHHHLHSAVLASPRSVSLNSTESDLCCPIAQRRLRLSWWTMHGSLLRLHCKAQPQSCSRQHLSQRQWS
jgi:hypothetical protein